MRTSIYILAVCALVSSSEAKAELDTCQVIKIYGWGKTQGVFTELNNPTTDTARNVGVIEAAPNDVHVTWKAGEAPSTFHLSIKNGPVGAPCEGNVNISGNFPGALTLANNNMICGVPTGPRLARLNAIQDGGSCKSSFTGAGLTESQITTFVNQCKRFKCP